MLYAVPGRFTGKRPAAAAYHWLVGGLAEGTAFVQCCDVMILIGPVNRNESYLLSTAAQAQVVVDRIGQPNVGLLLDAYHMHIEEQGIAATIRCRDMRDGGLSRPRSSQVKCVASSSDELVRRSKSETQTLQGGVQ